MNLSNLDCLEKGQRTPAVYIATYEALIHLLEEQGTPDAPCQAQRLRELKAGFEERNKDPRLMTDEEMGAQLETLLNRVGALRVEQDRRYRGKKAVAWNALMSPVVARIERDRAARDEEVEQYDALKRAEQAAAIEREREMQDRASGNSARRKKEYHFLGVG